MEEILKKYLEDKKAFMATKMAVIKYADSSQGYITTTPTQLNILCDGDCIIDKSKLATITKEVQDTGSITKSIVGNTYNWMDSHEDVHVKDCFAESIKNDLTPLHLHDHEFKIAAQVGEVQKTWEQKIAWKTLNVDKDGYTQALLINSDVKKEMNPFFYKQYQENKIQQHSVGMRYVNLTMAVNSEKDYFKAEKKEWDEIFPKLGNPDVAEKKGYFYVVREAKLIEVSAVLRGSNELTPTIKQDAIELTKKSYNIKDIRKSLDFLN